MLLIAKKTNFSVQHDAVSEFITNFARFLKQYVHIINNIEKEKTWTN